MTKEQKNEIISGFVNAERNYEVCIRTKMGGYMEFFTVERLIFEENAREVCDQYFSLSKGKDSFKSVCVRYKRHIIYEKFFEQ